MSKYVIAEQTDGIVSEDDPSATDKALVFMEDDLDAAMRKRDELVQEHGRNFHLCVALD